MLYELIAVVRPHNMAEVREIANTIGSIVLSSKGTIRAMRNWGVLRLPTRVHKNQAIYDEGHYFIMRFDTSSPTQEKVRTTLSLDPRMVRFSSVKLGDGKLLPGKGSGVRGRGLADFGSRIPWRDEMGVVPKSTK